MIQKVPLIGCSIADIQAEFEGLHRHKLMPIVAGSGGGRAGYEDGWIKEGFSNYRPYVNKGDTYFISEKVGNNILDAIKQVTDIGWWIVQIMFDHMAPRARLATHVDGAPYFERWHLPIKSLGCTFVEGKGATQQAIVMREGYWYGPISYWLPHSISNDTAEERIHMVVDFGPELSRKP